MRPLNTTEEFKPTILPNLTLSNLRLRYMAKNSVQSMLLEELASMHVTRTSESRLLYFCLAFLAAAIYVTKEQMIPGYGYYNYLTFAVWFLPVLFLLMYLDSIKTVFQIISRGHGIISIKIKRARISAMADVMDRIEEVKYKSHAA